MAFCQICGKGKTVGITGKHHRGVAGGQWKKRAKQVKRVFLPNLHSAWIIGETGRIRMTLCTKCLRMVKKDQSQIIVKPSVKEQTPAAVAAK